VGHVAWRGVASLRREKASFEKIKRLEKEMEIAVRRGERIENSCSRIARQSGGSETARTSSMAGMIPTTSLGGKTRSRS
jgi:hypothetical protein